MVVVKDRDNNIYYVEKDDPRYLSGELVGQTKGFVTAYNLNCDPKRVSISDSRFKENKLFGNRSKYITIITDGKNKRALFKDDKIPEGWRLNGKSNNL